MGIPDGQGARHITGNGGEKSKKKKKRKKNPEIRKRRAKRKEKSSKEGYEGATKERKREKRKRERKKRREFGNPNRVLLRLRFANNQDGVLYLETVSRPYDSQYALLRTPYIEQVLVQLQQLLLVLAFKQGCQLLLVIPYSGIILFLPECLRYMLSHLDMLLHPMGIWHSLSKEYFIV